MSGARHDRIFHVRLALVIAARMHMDVRHHAVSTFSAYSPEPRQSSLADGYNPSLKRPRVDVVIEDEFQIRLLPSLSSTPSR